MSKNQTKIIVDPGKLDLFIIREFDAPREMVFRAYTDESWYTQWLGPRGLEMKVETFEPKNGGSYRYIHIDQEGNEYYFHGVYHEVTAPERIIDTFEFEGMPEKGHVAFETARFEELPNGRTRVTSQSIFQTVEDRDFMIQSDMETGVREGFERLDELLEKNK